VIGHKALKIEEAQELLRVVDAWGDKNFVEDTDCFGNPCPASTLAELRYVDRATAFQILDEAVCPVYVTFKTYMRMNKTEMRAALEGYIRKMSR